MFQIFFIFHRDLGFHDPIWLAHIFQMGWWKTINSILSEASEDGLNFSGGGRSFHKFYPKIWELRSQKIKSKPSIFEVCLFKGDFFSVLLVWVGGCQKVWFTVGKYSVQISKNCPLLWSGEMIYSFFHKGNPLVTFTNSTVNQCLGRTKKGLVVEKPWRANLGEAKDRWHTRHTPLTTV